MYSEDDAVAENAEEMGAIPAVVVRVEVVEGGGARGKGNPGSRGVGRRMHVSGGGGGGDGCGGGGGFA